MNIRAKQNGIVAACDCGAKQFIPSASIAIASVLYCPCGHLHQVEKKDLNEIQKRSIRSYIYASTGKHPKPPRVDNSILQRTEWFEQVG